MSNDISKDNPIKTEESQKTLETLIPVVLVKRKPGRPRTQIYTDDLPSNWRQIILQCCAKGYSEAEIRAELCGININRWLALETENEQFRKVYLIGRVLVEAWWLKEGRKCIRRDSFQGYVWFQNMKNRFGWKDRQDLVHDVSESLVEKMALLSPAQLKQKANELLDRGLSRAQSN